jgi:hypothetical protein
MCSASHACMNAAGGRVDAASRCHASRHPRWRGCSAAGPLPRAACALGRHPQQHCTKCGHDNALHTHASQLIVTCRSPPAPCLTARPCLCHVASCRVRPAEPARGATSSALRLPTQSCTPHCTRRPSAGSAAWSVSTASSRQAARIAEGLARAQYYSAVDGLLGCDRQGLG